MDASEATSNRGLDILKTGKYCGICIQNPQSSSDLHKFKNLFAAQAYISLLIKNPEFLDHDSIQSFIYCALRYWPNKATAAG
jgi:hypothetical protein